MATAPTVDIKLALSIPQTFEVVRARIREGISELTEATIEIASREELELDNALSTDGVVSLLVRSLPTRYWTLKVYQITFVGAEEDSLRYKVELRAHAWLLRSTKNTRKFRKVTTEAIISKVLTECSVPFSWNTTRPTEIRNYTVQYHESNLDFVHRLLEFEGIYYTVDPDGVWVFADSSGSEPKVDGQTYFELTTSAGNMLRDFSIYDFFKGSSVASGCCTVNDHNWKTPNVKLIQTAKGGTDAELEIYNYPGGYRRPEVGGFLANLRLQALRVPAEYVEGVGDVVFFAPARQFEFGSAGGAAFAGEYTLTRIHHIFVNPMYKVRVDKEEDAERTYRNEFHAIPQSIPFRPPLLTPMPKIAGNHTVMVRGPEGEEIHTDVDGRFKAQFHWDREALGTDEDSRWVRMLQESATSQTLARIGWEMNVGYINGDPDRPIGLARDINGEMTPTYGQPSQKNMMSIKTPTYPSNGGFNEWRMDDSAGIMRMEVHAQRDLYMKTLNDKSEFVGNDEIHKTAGQFAHTVKRDQKVEIGANSETTSGEPYTLTVEGNRTITVGGNEDIYVSGRNRSSVALTDTETVGAVRFTLAGGITVPLPSPKEALTMLTDQAKGQAGAVFGGLANGAGGAIGGALGAAVSSSPGGLSAMGNAAAGALKGGAGVTGPGASVGGALQGGLAGAKEQLQGMVPSPAAIGDKLKGMVPTSLSSLIDSAFDGSIDRVTVENHVRNVGGAQIQAALANIDWFAGHVYAETVGGLKLTACGGSLGQNVDGYHAVTVGGLVMKKADKNLSYSSSVSNIMVGGAATYKSDIVIEMKSKVISINATGGVSLSGADGAASIEMKPGSVKMTGKVKLGAGDSITVSGNTDDLTG